MKVILSLFSLAILNFGLVSCGQQDQFSTTSSASASESKSSDSEKESKVSISWTKKDNTVLRIKLVAEGTYMTSKIAGRTRAIEGYEPILAPSGERMPKKVQIEIAEIKESVSMDLKLNADEYLKTATAIMDKEYSEWHDIKFETLTIVTEEVSLPTSFLSSEVAGNQKALSVFSVEGGTWSESK